MTMVAKHAIMATIIPTATTIRNHAAAKHTTTKTDAAAKHTSTVMTTDAAVIHTTITMPTEQKRLSPRPYHSRCS